MRNTEHAARGGSLKAQLAGGSSSGHCEPFIKTMASPFSPEQMEWLRTMFGSPSAALTPGSSFAGLASTASAPGTTAAVGPVQGAPT